MMCLNILKKGIKQVKRLVFLVEFMNKKTAISYAQIALNYLKSSENTEEITLENIAKEMNTAFKLYSNSVANLMAKSMVETEIEYAGLKNVSHS